VATQQRERLRLRLHQIVLVVPSCLSWALPDFLPTMVAVAGTQTRTKSLLLLLLLLPIPSFWQFQWLGRLLYGRLMLPVTSRD
jgi:hypothetical protein